MALDVPNTGHSKNGHSFIWSQGIYDGWVTITLLLIGLGCCCVLNKNHENDDRIFKDEVEEKYDENKSGKEEFDYVWFRATWLAIRWIMNKLENK